MKLNPDKRTYFLITLATLFSIILIFGSSAMAQDELPMEEVEGIINQLQQSYSKVEDYVCLFNKQEYLDGELLPMETIRLKFKKPFSVYMKWIKEPRKGMEVLYIRGENEGKMIAHPGSFPDITVRVSPTGKLAMRQNRHPVTDVGIGYAIQIISGDVQTAREKPEDKVEFLDLGIQDVNGERSQCFEAIMPASRDSVYYAHRAQVCVNLNTKLLSQIKIWDKTNTLVENYKYTDIRINVGLASGDFDRENPEYDF